MRAHRHRESPPLKPAVSILEIAQHFQVSEKTANRWLKDAITHFKQELQKRGMDIEDILKEEY